ncbi:MAG: stage II sporulation protein M [Saprospiraceae bacterium]
MRETQFINQNKRKWQEFESALDGQYHDPDRLSEQFIQITDDLSYARTFYPNRSVRVYLNGLAQRIFFRIYKSRRSPLRRIGQFWLDELPQLVYEARRAFLLAFVIFWISLGVGILSSMGDPQFANIILGESYVEMTIENIESGDPMAVYKQRGQFGMSLGITANNLFVAFLTFVMGVFFAVGSIAIMIRNGIMVGAFQYFFIERGLFWDSFLTIWIHGTLEISAIIIAGAAGITMGKGLVFPGTFTRLQSFQRSARRGVKIMIGIAPIIIMAGFIEGYLTRHTDTPDIIRGLFILACLAFVIIYFIWYPYIRTKYGVQKPIADAKIPPDNIQQLDFTKVKSSGEVFADMFIFYTRHFSKIALLALVTALIFTGAMFAFAQGKPADHFIFPNRIFGMIRALEQFFIPTIRYLPLVHLFTFGALTTGIFYWLQREASATATSLNWFGFLKTMVSIGMIGVAISIQQWFVPYLLLIIIPIVLTWAYIMQTEGLNIFNGLKRTFTLLNNNTGRVLGLILVLMLVGILFFLITDTMLLSFYLDLVSWVVPLEEAPMRQFSAVLLTFISVFILHLVFAMFIISFGLLYYTLLEIHEARHLRLRVQEIGVVRRIKGLEQES